MIEIAEMVPPTTSGLWTLVKQAGVDIAVGGLPTPADLDGGAPWDYEPLRRMKQRYEDGGFQLAVIEARPPLNSAKRGLPGRDEEIDHGLHAAGEHGQARHPGLVLRVDDRLQLAAHRDRPTPSRGGSLVTSFDHEQLRDAPPTELGPIGEDELWRQSRILPAPRGAGRRARRREAGDASRRSAAVADPGRRPHHAQHRELSAPARPGAQPGQRHHAVPGQLHADDDDLPGVIREFGRQGKIFFVHFRDVRGTPERVRGDLARRRPDRLLACMQAYRDIGFDGVLRPDHVPTVEGDSNADAGYSSFGRLYAIGYIRGLQRAVYAG